MPTSKLALAFPERLAWLRALQSMSVELSSDGAVNRDSIAFLLQFVQAESDNAFYASGAVRCWRATSVQLGAIIDLLAKSADKRMESDFFLRKVTQSLGIALVDFQKFPAPSTLSPDEEEHQHAEALAEAQASSQARREQAERDQKMDRSIADLLNVLVKELDGEWGWARVDNGERFSPTCDPAIAFELVERFRLDIAFGAGANTVTYRGKKGEHAAGSLSTARYEGSLARTVCAAALKKARLDGLC